MPDSSTLALFLAAALALLLVPGPSVLYIVARGIDQGRAAGLVSAVGVGLGSLTHVVAASLGLSALLLSSTLAFAVIKYAGAAYLVYLGVRTLLSRSPAELPDEAEPRSLPRVFVQGIVVEALNPKTALFFFAFLPQFIDSARGSVAAQTLVLGGLLVALGVCIDSLYALLAGSAGRLLRRDARILAWRRRLTGSVYIGLGLTTALAGSDGKK